jgi:hypothetical protein
MPATTIKVSPPSDFLRVGGWLTVAAAGICIGYPGLLQQGVEGLRYSEVVNAAALVALVVALLGRMPISRTIVTLLFVLLLTSFWIFDEIQDAALQVGSSKARMILIRWLMSFATAYWLAVLMDHPKYRSVVVYGLLTGLALSLYSILYDYQYFDTMSHVPPPFSEEQVVYVDDVYRAQGIFDHPNSAAGSALLAVPLILGMIEEERFPRWTIVAALGVIVLIFITTQTRGPTFAALVLVALQFGRCSRKHALCLVGLVAVGAVGLAIHQMSDSAEIVQRMSNVESGADDRARTTLESLFIAYSHPFGIGSLYENELERLTGFTATHDAFLQLAMLAGWPLGLFVFLRIARRALGLLRRRASVETWLAAYMLVAFVFENQFFVPTFVIFTLWMMQPGPALLWTHINSSIRESIPQHRPQIRELETND